MQFPIIVWAAAVIGFAIISYALPDFSNKTQFLAWANLTVLTLTLIVLVWYSYDTHRIAEQTIEANLRPVVLVQGVLDWNTLAFTPGPNATIVGAPIQFSVLKNIPLNFRGYVIIANLKRNLIFGNGASTQPNPNNPSTPTHLFLKTWAWVPPNAALNAIYDPSIPPMPVNEPNGICLEYSDVEGNIFHTTVDANYVQNSVPGHCSGFSM